MPDVAGGIAKSRSYPRQRGIVVRRRRLPRFYSDIVICRWVDSSGADRYPCDKAMTSTGPRVPGRPASLRLVQDRHETPAR
jgi:hypothetical protein